MTNLATESKEYLMHNCDFTGGAWFRSTGTGEEHAFFDAGTSTLYKNNGVVSSNKLVWVVNSKRGHYLTVIWDSVTGKSVLGYADPSSFWNMLATNQKDKPGDLHQKIVRLDVSNNSNRIYYFGLKKLVSIAEGNSIVADLRAGLFPWVTVINGYAMDIISLKYTVCDKTEQPLVVDYVSPHPDTIVRDVVKLDSENNYVAVQAKYLPSGNQYIYFYYLSSSLLI